MALIKEVGPKGKLHVEFDSPHEVLRAIKAIGWEPKREQASDRRGREGSFYSFGSLEKAIDIYKNHPDQIRTFDMKDDRIKVKESPGIDVDFDVVGDYVDVDRYLQGIPESFGHVTMGNPRNMFCTINILNVYVSYTDSKYQDAKAMRVLRLVDWLEQQGVRTQIVSSGDSAILFNSTIVKQFQDPFDLNHLAIVMHNDWLRRVLFLIMEQSKTWQSGYGSAVEYDRRMTKYVPKPEDGLYVYVGGYMSNGNDIADMEKQFDKIEEQIQKVIDDGMTYSEEPMMLRDQSYGW